MQKTVPDNRRALILDEAAKLFSARGYDSTSMRDIAAAVGMLP
ncbi:helix-turn-helix domain-containing protein, partial [Streptomyces galilaeus]